MLAIRDLSFRYPRADQLHLGDLASGCLLFNGGHHGRGNAGHVHLLLHGHDGAFRIQ